MTTLFERRHFEWLAAFAGARLTPSQIKHLCDELPATNPGFMRDSFLRAVERTRAPDVVSCKKPARRINP